MERKMKAASEGDLRAELAACERTLARLGPEEGNLSGRASALKSSREILGKTAVIHHPLASEREMQRPNPALSRIADIDRELQTIERRLAEISPKTASAYERSKQIREQFAQGRRTNMQAIVHAAALPLPSRSAYLAEKQKLADLKAQLDAAKEEYQRCSDSRRTQSGLDSKANALITRGTLPPRQDTATLEADLRRSAENVEIIRRAVEIQEQNARTVLGEYREELLTALSEARTSLVHRIAAAVREAAETTWEANLLAEYVSQETDSYYLADFVFHGIQPLIPTADMEHPFTTWLNDLRRQGYEV